MRGAPNSRATRARLPEVHTRQASPAIGRQHSPFGSTAFFVVRSRGCPHPVSRSPMKSTAWRVVWEPGYPQPTPRRNVRPAHRQCRLMHLPATGVECREAPPMLAPAIHSPFPSTAFRVVGGPVVHIHVAAEEALSHRHSAIDRMIRAGFPPTSVSGGTSRVTTEPAPTTAFSPTVTPPMIVAPIGSHIVRPGWPSYVSALLQRQVRYRVA